MDDEAVLLRLPAATIAALEAAAAEGNTTVEAIVIQTLMAYTGTQNGGQSGESVSDPL